MVFSRNQRHMRPAERIDGIKYPDASMRGINLATMQASWYQTLAAVAKWTCKHVRLARCSQEKKKERG